MLEANEVDVDFFTPTNTSLATIFSSTQSDRNDGNESLIYIPETPVQPGCSHNMVHEMQKSSSKCVFATSVSAYEWVENKYKLREKLGFAIIQDSKDDNHHLIIYTSEKNTLSLATIATKFIVKVKKDVNISYYDNYKRYWLISSSASKISEIVKYLETLKVNIEFIDNIQTEIVKEKSNTTEFSFENIDSDTDSVISKKNKDSILRRMATMGQSVLPPNKNIASKSTDSSDTNEYEHLPTQRHKPTKFVSKKSNVEKNLIAIQQNNEIGKETAEIQDSFVMPVKQEIISNMNLDPNIYDNNMINFISEQRINNSELRININRLSDRVEQLCKNMSCGQIHNQNDIINKLLKEYEKRIFSYERFMKLKGLEGNLIFINDHETVSSVMENNKSNESEIHKECENQDLKINELNRKIDIITVENRKQYEILLDEIDDLKQDLIHKDMILKSIDKNIQELTASSLTEDNSNKLKNIINNTYQTISVKFNDDDDYKGSMVKNIVAKIIKKTTMECINDSE